jgi:hypothetical protein
VSLGLSTTSLRRFETVVATLAAKRWDINSFHRTILNLVALLLHGKTYVLEYFVQCVHDVNDASQRRPYNVSRFLAWNETALSVV